MGSLGHSCLVHCVEWVLQGESTSSSEGAGAESVEHGRLGALKPDWLDRLSELVSWGSVQVIGCCSVRYVSGWDTVFRGREEIWGGLQSFREDR